MSMELHKMIKLLPTTEDAMRAAPKGTFPDALLSTLENINSHYIKGESHSMQITKADEETRFSTHAHMPQWSAVLAGTATFTFEDGSIKTYGVGESYFLANQLPHSAVLSKGYMDVSVFLNDPSLLEE